MLTFEERGHYIGLQSQLLKTQLDRYRFGAVQVDKNIFRERVMNRLSAGHIL